MHAFTRTTRRSILVIAGALAFVLSAAGCRPGHDQRGNLDAAPNVGATGGTNTTQPVRDSWITDKVEGKLATVKGVDTTDLRVKTDHGTVQLFGHADSQQTIVAAVAAVKTIKGVKHVDISHFNVAAATHHG